MKSWVGIILMTSDELALPSVIKALKDPKMPPHIQEAILDTICAVLEPIVCKVRLWIGSFCYF
jgi:hypothetical protein